MSGSLLSDRLPGVSVGGVRSSLTFPFADPHHPDILRRGRRRRRRGKGRKALEKLIAETEEEVKVESQGEGEDDGDRHGHREGHSEADDGLSGGGSLARGPLFLIIRDLKKESVKLSLFLKFFSLLTYCYCWRGNGPLRRVVGLFPPL